MVLGRGEVAGVDSLGVERISQHGFPCGLRHPRPRRLEVAVLCPDPPSQLWELRVGPALPPLSLGGARSWAEEWAWVGVMGPWGLVVVAGLGDSS